MPENTLSTASICVLRGACNVGKDAGMTPHVLTTPSAVTGTRIRELRDRSGVSRQSLATRSSVHASNLARIERGCSNPSLDTLVRIADALGTSVADLVRDVRQR